MRLVRRPERRGQALVEFALILPVFVLVLVGLFDAGRAVFAATTVNNAAREGARQAIVDQTLSHIQAHALSQAVGLDIGTDAIDVDYRDPSTPNSPNSCLTTSGVSKVGSNAINGCLAVVRVAYPYVAVTPIVGNILGPQELVGESFFPVEHNCQEPGQPQCPLGD
jgi:Flp pilus assembly protein TadG